MTALADTPPVSTPLVSLIVRTQGRRLTLLSRALASIAAQTHAHIEALVVEDGSDRARAAVADANAVRPGAFIHHPLPKSGRCAAGNAGMKAARGAYLGFLDEDDELYPDHVELLLNALASAPSMRLAYAMAEVEYCEGLDSDRPQRKALRPHDGLHPFSRTQLWLRNRLPIQSALFKRSLFEEKGGLDPQLDCFEDWDLWLRYSADEDFLAVSACTSLYRMPASKKDLSARLAEHEKWMPALRDKHRALEGVLKFSEVALLPQQSRDATPFRQAARIAAAAFIRRAKEMMGGRS